ncbi:MAG: hypothetical protein OXH13_05985 [Chloroflexi bacterium]|nr:hypothetical protein [Chloroflexota bacterium]MCY3696360.1 hypothetical protein [Chloroflexota bacterium]MXX32298.1 hypothetical protein [Chloroflexota bacterium]MYD16920.1 hypothetical protein [Chloroflexota bacterium]MYJ02472.1 hypothetical protein [Chloroflexota bacterium]
MRVRACAVLSLILIAGLAASCDRDDRNVISPTEAAFVPVIESSELYVAMPRLVLTLLDRDRQPEFSDDALFRIRYFDPTEAGIKFHSESELTSITVEGLRYLVAKDVPFDEPGQWAVAVTVELSDGSSESSPRLPILVTESARGLTPGDRAPDVPTPTIADGVLERMAAVEDVRRAMYERSASQLLNAGEPFLIVWTSAARCAGRLACARALEQAASVSQEAEIAVLHVEPFGRPRSGTLQQLIDDAVDAWSIEAEPQFFIVDSDGAIASRFEIVVEELELSAAIDEVLR